MKHIHVLMTAPILPGVVEALASSFTLHRLWEQPDQAAYLDAVGGDIRGFATSTLSGRVDARLLDRLPALEIIANFGVGYENVDVASAMARGIMVTNTPGVLDDEVADLTIGLLLGTLRQIPQADRFVRQGRWLESTFPLSATLRDRRVGIVGLGSIGKAVARRLEGFGIPISYHGRTRQPHLPFEYHPTLVGLAEASDVLIVIVPGGAETKHLIGSDVLAALGPEGIFINVSRGSVVDERALIEALQSGTILGAGLDVYENEPRVPEPLIALSNVVLLPHIGSASHRTRAAMGQLVVNNLRSWFELRRPINPVPEAGHLLRA